MPSTFYPRFFFFGAITVNSLVVLSGLLRNSRYKTIAITLQQNHELKNRTSAICG